MKVFKYKDSSASGHIKADVGFSLSQEQARHWPPCTPANLLPVLPPSLVPRAQVYVSFGGLLMQLTGDPKRLEDLDLDQDVYLLMRKV